MSQDSKGDSGRLLTLGLSIGIVAVMLFNIFLGVSINGQLNEMGKMHESLANAAATGFVANAGQTVTSTTATPAVASNTANVAEIAAKVIPTGVPAVYGAELGVSFDDTVNSLNKLSKLDGDLYENGEIKFSDLTPEQQQRYVKVGQSIACEYCCGATTMVQKNGQPACGCAHSASMRGVVKYLLKNHENEYSDEQLLEEAANWKALSFPKQTVEKAMRLSAENGQIDAVSVATLPSQVGGC